MKIEFEPDHLVITIGKRVVHVPCASEGETAIISLDEVSEWHVPAGEEIGIADLSKITVLIEKVFEARGQDVEFE